MTAITTAQLDELGRMIGQWPRDWSPSLGEEGEWSGWWNCISQPDDDADRVSADVDEDYAVDLANFVASIVNAAPALVAIARAALAWSEARSQDDHDAAAHALRDAVRGAP